MRHFLAGEVGGKDAPIILRLARLEGPNAVFENPVHTRPRTAAILRTGPDSLTARSAIVAEDGSTRVIEVDLEREA